ncbi:aldehyde dehydrogenase [Dactylosporangium sp. AC04546]|uniref:aldehyde dehydrogenase n=1 Tax=Dactylosporangium sp. AC04546 TaxID=2862460 RepID=UPI001EDD9C25|nr:aldehyde dehydrogenase [Dactylosporangium sp. AC04546]WVK86951.1 aldehyde dehydrogenase [Dactylosporangium sp. AC04546]
MRDFGMMIGGRQTPAGDGRTFESIDPFTGEPWARIARAAPADVDAAVRNADAAFRSSAWSGLTASARGGLLVRLADLVLERLEELVEVESRDNGKSRKELWASLRTMAEWYRYYGGMADKVLGQVIPVDRPASLNYTVHEPYGVVAAILPWNSPLRLAGWKIAPALAAGNAVVLKPSEHASASSIVFNELFEAAGFPAGIVNVVTGIGPDVVPALIAHPLVGKVSFTGGVAAGRLIGELAAKQLKPCTLELGGKSPQIVFPDADLDRAAAGISAGVFSSGGQTCLAGSRLLVHSSVHDGMLRRIIDQAKQVRLGDPADPFTDVGPVATAAQHRLICEHIATARTSGAVVAFGGETTDERFVGPTVFDGVSRESRLFQEEVFGPVLAVTRFETEEEAIELANDVPFGLAAGVWTRDIARAHRVARRVQAGTVWINTYRNTVPQSPFGGYKTSGLGRESGFEGIKEYLQVKSIWVDLGAGS